jgi:hypothetical protein
MGVIAPSASPSTFFTQGDPWDELRSNVREAVRAYFFDQAIPERVRRHLVRDEVFAPV